MVIDGDNCTNVVSEDVTKKLELQIELHPNSYKVAWVNNISLKMMRGAYLFY